MDLFIDEVYIKENSPITSNVDPKNLKSHIVDAQNMQLAEILGTDFLKYLLDKYVLNTLSVEELKLVDEYIKPALVYRAFYLALPFITLNINNKGVIDYTDDNAVNPSFQVFNSLRNSIDDRASFRENLLLKYLCKNSKDFPLYKTQDSLTPPSTESRNSSGFIFY